MKELLRASSPEEARRMDAKDTRKSGWLLEPFPFSGSGKVLIHFGLHPGIHTVDWCVILSSFHFARFIYDKIEAPVAPCGSNELDRLSYAGREALLIQVQDD
jgi:hypothetical protein